MPVENLTLDQFRAFSTEARADWYYAATSAQINALHDALLAAGWNPSSGGPSILSLASDGARRRLAREIDDSNAANAGMLQAAYRAAKAGA